MDSNAFFFLLQKKEKRRWLFKKTTNQQESSPTTAVQQGPRVKASSIGGPVAAATGSDVSEQRHAIAVAVATAAAAEAAVATAQAAMEVARLTRSTPNNNANHPREHYAAILIQTSFRGYLVRVCFLLHQNTQKKKKDYDVLNIDQHLGLVLKG